MSLHPRAAELVEECEKHNLNPDKVLEQYSYTLYSTTIPVKAIVASYIRLFAEDDERND